MKKGKTGCFDIGAVGDETVGEKGDGRAVDQSVAVVGRNFLEEEGSGDYWFDGISASASVADCVAVDFVDDVSSEWWLLFAIVGGWRRVFFVGETGNVYCAAGFGGTDPGGGTAVDERVGDFGGCCEGETVDRGRGFDGCRVVHDECAVGKDGDVGGPDARGGCDP